MAGVSMVLGVTMVGMSMMPGMTMPVAKMAATALNNC